MKVFNKKIKNNEVKIERVIIDFFKIEVTPTTAAYRFDYRQ
jgi:hypothetical protein